MIYFDDHKELAPVSTIAEAKATVDESWIYLTETCDKCGATVEHFGVCNDDDCSCSGTVTYYSKPCEHII